MSVYIIAEAGVNHNGIPELAYRLIDAAANAGADAVKFQSFHASEMVTSSTAKATYQQEQDGDKECQYEMLKKLELSESLHIDLCEHACNRKIQFMSTAFDFSSLDLLTDKLKLQTIKISSGELTNHPFIFEHARKRVKLILSTGMATLDEIQETLEVITLGLLLGSDELPDNFTEACKAAYQLPEGKAILEKHVTLLHCTSDYPTRLSDVNLLVMQALNERFGLQVGYSDHTLGVKLGSLAVAAGASVLEKHFTLDKSMPGPDHAMSLCVGELAEYIALAREAELIMGARNKSLTSGELENRKIGRKSIVALTGIREGEAFTQKNMGLKRSGDPGLEPQAYWSLLGKVAANDLEPDAAITLKSIGSDKSS